MTKKNKRSFEELLNRLEEIIGILEGDNPGLDESIKLYEEGILLSKECYGTLKNADFKITELKKDLEKSLSDNNYDDE